MRRLILIILAAAAAYYAYTTQIRQPPASGPIAADTQIIADAAAESSAALRRAFVNQQSNLQVEVVGVVENLLSDDNDGAAHQRFLVKLVSGQTVLIAHNIDLAPRVESIAVGDHVVAYGVYEWNNKGGVVHWTHGDPASRHTAGWIKHQGRTYQ